MIRLAGFLVCLALAGCGSAPTQETKEVDLGAVFTLAPGARVSLRNEDMRIRFVTVTEDSRCPRGVTCVWAGEVKVQLEVQNVKFAARFDIPEAGGASVGEYRITLVRVEPQPTSTARIAAQDYRASLKIDRLN